MADYAIPLVILFLCLVSVRYVVLYYSNRGGPVHHGDLEVGYRIQILSDPVFNSDTGMNAYMFKSLSPNMEWGKLCLLEAAEELKSGSHYWVTSTGFKPCEENVIAAHIDVAA